MCVETSTPAEKIAIWIRKCSRKLERRRTVVPNGRILEKIEYFCTIGMRSLRKVIFTLNIGFIHEVLKGRTKPSRYESPLPPCSSSLVAVGLWLGQRRLENNEKRLRLFPGVHIYGNDLAGNFYSPCWRSPAPPRLELPEGSLLTW